jgi:hypothetical protein
MSQHNSINPIQNPAPELYFADYDPKEFKRPKSYNPLWNCFVRSISLKVCICQVGSCGKVYRHTRGAETACWRHLAQHHPEVYQTTRMKQKEIDIKRKRCLCLLCNKSYCTHAVVRRHQNAAHRGVGTTYLCTWCGKRLSSGRQDNFRRLVFSIRVAAHNNCSF